MKRYLQKNYFSKVGTSAHHQLFQESYILEKANNSGKNKTLYYLLFLESSLFRAATFSKDATFYSIYLFKKPGFIQDTFSEELIFHSYAYFPQLHYLFIC